MKNSIQQHIGLLLLVILVKQYKLLIYQFFYLLCIKYVILHKKMVLR